MPASIRLIKAILGPDFSYVHIIFFLGMCNNSALNSFVVCVVSLKLLKMLMVSELYLLCV